MPFSFLLYMYVCSRLFYFTNVARILFRFLFRFCFLGFLCVATAVFFFSLLLTVLQECISFVLIVVRFFRGGKRFPYVPGACAGPLWGWSRLTILWFGLSRQCTGVVLPLFRCAYRWTCPAVDARSLSWCRGAGALCLMPRTWPVIGSLLRVASHGCGSPSEYFSSLVIYECFHSVRVHAYRFPTLFYRVVNIGIFLDYCIRSGP